MCYEQVNQLRHNLELNEKTGSCAPSRRNYIRHFLGIFFSFLLMRSAEHDSFTKIRWVYILGQGAEIHPVICRIWVEISWWQIKATHHQTK